MTDADQLTEGSDRVLDDTVFVRVEPIEEVLPEDKIPDVGHGEALMLGSDPDKPFQMICTLEDLTIAMKSLDMLRNGVDDVER